MTAPIDTPSSILRICNLALSSIGTRSTITSIEEPSPEAINCKLWYDTLRRQLLRCANWGFARRQQSLSLLGDLLPDGTSPYPWLFKYLYPADAIKFRYILCPPIQSVAGGITPPQVGLPIGGANWLSPSRNNRFIVANELDEYENNRKLLLTNVEAAIGVYTANVTDPTIFDSLFEDALISALAYQLVIPLSGNVSLKKDMKILGEAALTQARVADGNEAVPTTDHSVDWLVARNSGGGWPGAFPAVNGIAGPTWGNWYEGNDVFNWGS